VAALDSTEERQRPFTVAVSPGCIGQVQQIVDGHLRGGFAPSLSRRLLTEALSSINARAAKLQQRDRGRAEATERFRAGAFIFSQTEDTDP
jgi:hypothetical protein